MKHLRSHLRTVVLLGLALVFCFADPNAAEARSRSSKKAKATRVNLRLQRIGIEVATVPFGQDLAGVVDWARNRLDRRYAPLIADALDMHERAALRARFKRDVQAVERSLVSLDGTRSGYEVSIISGEFVPGTGESILRFLDGQVEHYFFFTEGTVWKYARPLPAQATFQHRLEQYTRDQGQPASTTGPRGRAEGPVAHAVWQGQDREIQLSDRRSLYGSDLVVVLSRPDAKIALERRGGRTPEETDTKLDPELEGFLEDGDSQ